jgi:glycosyltransferase involved in cell wall biosynthesis
MKVAMIGQKGVPTSFGGVERHVENLAVRLGALGHDVTVYTRKWYAPANRNFTLGVRVVATPTIRTKHFDAITHTLASTVHALLNRADVIHYHGVGPALLSWIPRLFAPRVRVVATFHSVDRQHRKWGLIARFALGLGERAACRFPHEVIVVSRALQSYCRDRYDCGARYVPNGVELPPEGLGDDALKKFGLAKGRYLIATGRLIPVKGFHRLIKAFRRLKKEGGTDGMKLAIVGGPSYSSDYERRLKRLAGRDGDIVMTGLVSGIPLQELIAGAYAAVQPSEVEGLSLSVLEAMAHGKAVLASDIPGNLEALGEHGLFFRSRDVGDLADKLDKLVRDRHLAGRLGAAGREHVMAHYDWDEIAEATDRVYRSVAPAEAAGPSRGLLTLLALGIVGLLVYFVFFDKD